MRKVKPVTPGELLKEEFLAPMAITQYRLAKEIEVYVVNPFGTTDTKS